jgi:ABC-type transport system involved in multi-copper enzyme maturation permease subunit
VIFLAALVKRSFARVVGLLAGVALMLAGLQVVLVAVAASQQRSQSFDLIGRLAPAFVQQQFGAAFPLFLSFSGLVTFGYFHPVVMLLIALFVAFLGTELSGDVEGGHVDLLLSRPIHRRVLVTRSLLLVLITPIVLVAMMTAASRIGLLVFAPDGVPWPDLGVISRMAMNLVAVAWCFGTLGIAMAAFVKRRLNAMGPAAIVAVSMYLLELLGGIWRPLSTAAVMSPFHYYRAPAILAGTAQPGRDVVVLAAMSAVFITIAYWRFNTRDV